MQPTRRDLRVFGVGVGAFLALFGTLAMWPAWPFSEPHPRAGGALAGLGTGLLVLGVLAPGVLRPVRAAWMRVVAPIAWFNTRLLLGIVFYGILVPTGLVRRLFGDPLAVRTAPQTSYWITKEASGDAASYRRQI